MQARKHEADIHNEKVAKALVLGDCANFWREVNKAGFSGRPSCYSAIGGSTTPADIADNFRRMFADIYQADFVNTNELKHFRTELDLKCAAENWQLFTSVEVAAACKQLKPFKKESDLLLNLSALINASVIFFDLLCDLFNAIILHGYVPSSWKTGTVIPILKSGNPHKNNLSSYRLITLSSLFGKVFDFVFYNRYFVNLCTSDYLCGFKKRHSINHCTFVVKEVISYYCNNESNVFSCALDMQKAFDKVKLVVLFKKLIPRDISLHMIRLLFDLYYMLSLSVLWNGCMSKQFISYIGVVFYPQFYFVFILMIC